MLRISWYPGGGIRPFFGKWSKVFLLKKIYKLRTCQTAAEPNSFIPVSGVQPLHWDPNFTSPAFLHFIRKF